MCKHKGFTLIETLLILLTISVVSFGTWYVWKNQQTKPTEDVTENTVLQTPNLQPALEMSKLPTGWTVGRNEGGSIQLDNQEDDCFVGSSYIEYASAATTPESEYFKGTVDSIKSKGYTVSETLSSLTIVTKNGEKQIASQDLEVVGSDSLMSQKYAYISDGDHYAKIQLSCASSVNLPNAQAALLAITFSN